MKKLLGAIMLFALCSCNSSQAKVDNGYSNRDEGMSAKDYRDRGFEKLNLGDYEGAIKDYKKAIELFPDFKPLLQPYIDKAWPIVESNMQIKLNPNDEKAYKNRGDAKYELGKLCEFGDET